MSAAEALKAARAAGIGLEIDGDALLLDAVTAPPPSVLDLLARHKAGIVALLRPANDGWSGEDWLAFFDERAGIAEFDGGLSREQAEARAFAACVIEWLNDKLLPFGTEPTHRAWLHSRCWSAWHAARKAEAIVALAAMGIIEPRTSR